ncbi:MAG: isoleucine--tRNA ligase [Bacilli bacterium]|nr:isoleucine--tRNA ligase [Bacilli bacterium]
MRFEKLKNGKINEIEKGILDSWNGVYNILNQTIENRKNSSNFVFYDGPATANGYPGLHHMMAKFLKDSFCKYQTMRGHKVLRKVGWDTHGLPVELQVEKELGFSGKGDIEKYGVEKFNQECRNIVWKNEEAFTDLTEQMGQFIDLKHPYVTYDNDYIETEWWILQKFFEEGLFYEGSKILPYCPRCGTGLASHEVAQGYEEVIANTVIVPFKKKDEDCFFLVWTTTPWTLSSNVALCVNPKEKYVKVRSKDHQFILAKALLFNVLGEEVEILEEYLGKDLEYMEYEQLIPDFSVNKKAFFVTLADYVTMEDGTGIVHIAPAFGEDDAKVGKEYNLPYLNPVGEDGKYLEGTWSGTFVFDADIEVIKYLKENDKLFKKQKVTHQYPHCWRCHTPLIYYSKPSFYIETTKLKDKIIKANQSVLWHPSFVGEKRFGNWLENMKDWAISRNRYWGTPLPLWRCSCGHDEMIGSRKELIEKSIEKIDETIDLHRPYVDDIHITCKECGKTMSRVSDVIDCWFDSGSMPFAQYHYPFENQKLWEEQFPADFIAEGIDQTRGWFYTLLVISVFLTGKSPYKNVLVNDMLLDKFGKKMSKSKGNIVEPFTTIEEFGADTVRFYLPYVSPVWTPLRFDKEGLKEIYSKYISTLKNAYSFFEMYANADSIDPREYDIEVEKRELIDKWLLSKLNRLVKIVVEGYEEYDLNKVVKAIIPFLNDDLSNWYIRSNRRRFWDSELTESKKAVYLTTYEVLVILCKLTAPITPYISEEIYQKLTGEKSVHLSSFPDVEESLINERIEEKMDLVRDVCRLGRDARETANIKVRQPIHEVILSSDVKEIIGNLDSIIKEELNVKQIIYQEDMTSYLTYSLKPNFKVLGKQLGPKIKQLQEELKKLTSEEAFSVSKSPLTILLDGEDFTLDCMNTITSTIVKEGYVASNDTKTCVVLDTNLDEDLILEGLAREFVRTIQSIRKDKDFVITDHIHVFYDGDEKIDQVVEKYQDYIMGETLANGLIKKESSNRYLLNEVEVFINVEKI